MRTLSRKDKATILGKVDRLVATKHFNPVLNGADWPKLVDARREAILATGSVEAFEKEMQALLQELKTSHTGFLHESAQRVPARHAICATFQRFEDGSLARWMFQDVHDEGPAAEAGIRPGDILLAIAGKEATPPEGPAFSMGQSVAVEIEMLSGQRRTVNLKIPTPKSRKRPIVQAKLVTHSRLSGGIGLLKVTMFPGMVGIGIAREISHAIGQLHGCRRLIIDLRGNTGGGIGCLRLMSHLTPGKLPVGYSLTKAMAARGYDKQKLPRFDRIPDRKLALIRLALRYRKKGSIVVVTEGLGPQEFHGRVVLLVNQHSASAAEMVAGFARENSLAKIVGTTTPGRLLSGTFLKVGHGYSLGLPGAAYLTWQGTMLEGKGITPDEEVGLSRELLKQGRDSQLERAIEVTERL
jgi:carboxyl-terminal processing protease